MPIASTKSEITNETSLALMWTAFERTSSPEEENSSKPLPHPRISLYGSHYRTLIPNTESGEGVVSSGIVVQVLDYYPFGSERIDTGTDVSQRQYIGEMYDEESSMSYLNARYYQNTRGQFISQDPSFWTLPANLMLDPQLQNSYGYARNNPIIYKDPNGDIPVLVVTAGIGAVIGGVSGVTAQAISDYATGESFKASNYAGAFAGGAVQGGMIGSGVGLLTSGAAGGLAQGVTREGIDAYNGEGFGYEDAAGDVIGGAVLGPLGGKLKGPAVAGITAGRNSMSAVAKSTATKVANRTINSYTVGTAGKIATSYAVGGAYGTAAGVAVNSAYNVARSGNISSASSYLSSAASAVAKGNFSAAGSYLSKAAKALRGK